MFPSHEHEYVVYYWGACKKFWGRAIGIILTLEQAGATYTVKEKEEADFTVGLAVPMVVMKT